jgi:hypothetical protein
MSVVAHGPKRRMIQALQSASLAVAALICTAHEAVLAQAAPNPPTTTAPATQGADVPPDLRRIALKSGESVELGAVYYIMNCRSVMVGKPVVEILEGPPEVSLTIKEGDVLPRRQGCSGKVPGGTLIATAAAVKETKIARLIYRVKYKTKDGDRQVANAYYVGLVP